MAGIRIRITTEHKQLDAIIAALPGVDGMIADLGADIVVDRARQNVPVDTGFLKSTIEKIVSGGLAVVQAWASYSGYVEYGTRKMAAQPFLIPAFESVRWRDIAVEALHRIGL